MRKLLSVGVVVAVLLCSIGFDGICTSDDIESESNARLSQTYTPHASILIDSNDDFAGEASSGDGSQGNPYTIEWLEFTGEIDGACISISGTTDYFRISHCSFAPSTFAAAVSLQDVSNGEILYSITGDSAWGIIANYSSTIRLEHLTLLGTCIIMELSWMCSVTGCSIGYAPGDGVFFNGCSQMTVEGCEISNSAACGISLAHTGESSFFQNVINGNSMEPVYISGVSSNNRIYNNEIHTSPLGGARDDGITNYWDDGVSIGNWWSDYDESGFYYITGSAGSIDHYPRGASSPTIITNTTNTTPGPGEALITTWAPMDLSVRAILALSIGMLYGALVIIVIKRLR